MSALRRDLALLSNAENAVVWLDYDRMRLLLRRILPMSFSYVRAPRSQGRLLERKHQTVDALRSAMVEVAFLSEQHGIVRRLANSVLSNVEPDTIIPRASEAMDGLVHATATVRDIQHLLSPSMLAALVWRLGYSAALCGVTFHAAGITRAFSTSRTGTPTTVRIPTVNLRSDMTPSERAEAYLAAWPRVVYRPEFTVPSTVWSYGSFDPIGCSVCSSVLSVLAYPDMAVLEPYRRAFTTGYTITCRTCAAIPARPCVSCGTPVRSDVMLATAPPQTDPVTEDTLALQQTPLCSGCLASSNLYRRVSTRRFGEVHVEATVAARMVLPVVYNYSHQPVYRVSGGAHERIKSDTLCFGVELECGFGRTPKPEDYYLSRLAALDIYFKHDGSVSGGIEMISHPFTWSYWQERGQALWSDRLKTMKGLGMLSYNWPNCGMHVHTSKAAYTTAQVVRLLDLVYGNTDFFARVSQREVFDYCRLADEDKMTRERRLYRAMNSVGLHNRPVQSLKTLGHNARMRSRTADRRTAVHFPDNKPTVEIRLFRGTLHAPSFFKNIELCHAMHAFTLSWSSDDSRALKPFLAFIYDNAKTYRHLAQFIDKWYRRYRPVTKSVPPQYAVVSPPMLFENTDTAIAAAS